MTCIAGVAYKGEVFIGGDSASSNGQDMTIRKDPKVFTNGPFLIGYTSSFRMGQVLQYSFVPPSQGGMDTYEYMVTTFIDKVRECFQAGGCSEKINGRESAGIFLVGYQGRLFKVDSDYQVAESADGIRAIGCGANIALGALYALKDIEPRERIRRALEAAERFSAGVRGPFMVERLSAEVSSASL